MRKASIVIGAAGLWALACATGCENDKDESNPVSAEEAKEELRELSDEIEEQNEGEGFIEAPDTDDDSP